MHITATGQYEEGLGHTSTRHSAYVEYRRLLYAPRIKIIFRNRKYQRCGNDAWEIVGVTQLRGEYEEYGEYGEYEALDIQRAWRNSQTGNSGTRSALAFEDTTVRTLTTQK